MLSLRPATITDLALLNYWDNLPHVIASDPDDDWEWEKELRRTPPWREQLMAIHAGKAIGFVQIIDPAQEESHYWGDVAANQRAIDLWIGEIDYLNRGYGTQIMQMVIERCFADSSVHTILIDPLQSNLAAHRFYERLGFQFLYLARLGDSDCRVYALSRSDWEATK